MLSLPKSVGIVLSNRNPPTRLLSMNRADRKRRSRLRVEGPLAPYFEPYSEYLADRGYSQVSYWKKTFLVSEFSRWLGQEKIAAGEITAEHEEAFLRYNAERRCPKQGDHISLTSITSWLQKNGIIEGKLVASADTSDVDRIVQEYEPICTKIVALRQQRSRIMPEP